MARPKITSSPSQFDRNSPGKPRRRPSAGSRTARAKRPRPEPALTFASWIRKWRIGPGMNDRHSEILDMFTTYERWDPGSATEMRALHAEGLYSGYDGTVGPGWLPFLDRLTSDLVELGWDRDLHQVKSKFWTLRFYVGRTTAKMVRRIRAAEREALRTCCVCGCKVTPALRPKSAVPVPGYCKRCLAAEFRSGKETWLQRQNRARKAKRC